MKNLGTTKKIIFFLLALVFIVSCSTRKNKWLNRNFHAMGTYYNILYNGNLALEQGKQTLVQDYFDDYWTILPVERMPVKNEEGSQISASVSTPALTPASTPAKATLPGSFGKNASVADVPGGPSADSSPSPSGDDFAIAEEKATKAIQKHSMLIDGTEYNPQVDEAFLLLGKARYYDQRFVPALAAFNHILNSFPDKTTIIPAKIWKAKTQLRMDFPQLALKNLREILNEHATDTTASFQDIMSQLDKNKGIEDEHLAAISATMAQAYINLDQKEKAIVPISIAAEKTEDQEERGRYLYIKGQLYDDMGMTDSANVAFDEIIELKRRTPRIYRIHAFMEKIKNSDITAENRVAMLELLTELAENRENRPYLDNIYYQFAEYYYEIDSIETAIVYYNKSLRENSPDKYLNSRDYLTLGNINFDRAEYKEAGAYYDSTLTNLPEGTREYRKLKKKRENLDDVIMYEGIAQENDSILNLVAMSDAERLAYFSEYTEKIKAEQIEKEIAAFEAAKSAKQNTGSAGNFKQTGFNSGGTQSAGKFYFYDPTQVAYGKLAFTQTWGDRALQDNWRTDDSGGGGGKDGEKEEKLTEEAIIAKIEANPQFDPQTYLAKIPTEQTVIDSLKTDRDFAYYQLGVIYKEKFDEYELAANKLEALLKNNPEERLVLPAKYNLYKIYLETGETAKANQWKNDILTNHAESRYAQIIKNPQEYRAGEDSPEAIYADVYRKYLDGQYELVIQKSDEYITKFTGDPIVPKFELLKAVAIGRYHGYDKYKEALNFVALNYPLSDEGKKAQELYDNAVPPMAFQKFEENDPGDSYNLIYVFPKDSLGTGKAEKLRDTLSHAVANMDYGDLNVSIDTYNSEKIFVAIHGLDSHLGAKGFGVILRDEEDYQIEEDFFVVSSSNYETILIHKNLEDYLLSTGNTPKTDTPPDMDTLPNEEQLPPEPKNPPPPNFKPDSLPKNSQGENKAEE